MTRSRFLPLLAGFGALLGAGLGACPAQAQFGSFSGFGSGVMWQQALPRFGQPSQPIPFLELAFDRPIWLVRARVSQTFDTSISKTREKFYERAQLNYEPDDVVILQSFTGPDLTGRHCKLPDNHSYNSDIISDGPATPDYPVGQEVLLTVAPDQPHGPEEKLGDKISVTGSQNYGYYGGLEPVIVLGDTPWATANRQYAAAIGRAYAAPPQHLEGLLRSYTRGTDPNLAIWAMRNLGYWINCAAPPHPYATSEPQLKVYPLRDRDASLNWLWQLTNDAQRPVPQQLALDELLHQLDAARWVAAPQRMTFLERLCGGRLNSAEAYAVEDYVQVANRRRQAGFSSPQLLILFRTLFHNRSIPDGTLSGLLELDPPNKEQPVKGQAVKEPGFTTSQWLAFCAESLSPTQQSSYASVIEKSLVQVGGLPAGSEADSNLLLAHWQAGLSQSPNAQQWNMVRHAIATLKAMQAGVHFTIRNDYPMGGWIT